MTMQNSYWKKRMEEISQIQFDRAEQIDKQLVKEYEKATKYIQQKIELYYKRYAFDHNVKLADSKKILNGQELKEFKMTIEEFREKAINNDDGKWTKELDTIYLRQRVTRLEAIKIELENRIYELKKYQEKSTAEHLSTSYSDSYYRTMYELEKTTGIGIKNFSALSEDKIKEAVYTKWLSNKNFSDRIWDDRDSLISNMNKIITQGLIIGSSSDTMIAKLQKAMNVSRNRASAVIMTETTFIIGKANTEMYKEFGVKEYEVIETLDSTTCETCASMDGLRFKVSEKVEGVNAPPFHPHCRGNTVPVSEYEEIWGKSDRIARDPVTGETYYTKAKNYEEWRKEIDTQYGDNTLALEHKKKMNYAKDYEQLQNYQNVFGNEKGLDNIDDFQDLKYNNTKEYDLMKSYYKQSINNSFPEDMTYKVYKNNLTSTNWKAVGFNPNYVESHKKHLKEFGDITWEEYQNKAKKLLNSKDIDVERFISNEGTHFVYKESTNEFACARENGITQTYFKPKDKENYWIKEVLGKYEE